MNKPIKTAVFFTLVIVLAAFYQNVIMRALYSGMEMTVIVSDALSAAIPDFFISIIAGLLMGFMWKENMQHETWKKIVLRATIATLVLMVVNTFYVLLVVPQQMGHLTIMQYFFTNFQTSFMYACIYTLVWLVVPDDVEKEAKQVNNPGVIDGEIK